MATLEDMMHGNFGADLTLAREVDTHAYCAKVAAQIRAASERRQKALAELAVALDGKGKTAS